jgi:hypothetical protein
MIPWLSVSAAQTGTGLINISSIRTGWSDDIFAVLTTQPMINPAGCSSPDGYSSNIAQAGYKTHYAAALLAHASGKQVQLVINNTTCFQGRPVIMQVQVY